MGRPNWYYDHPPTCTCAECTGRRLRKGKGWSPSAILQRLSSIFRRLR